MEYICDKIIPIIKFETWDVIKLLAYYDYAKT
jgi:hypothetical protein